MKSPNLDGAEDKALCIILFNLFTRLTALPRGRTSKNSVLSIGGNVPFLAPLKQKTGPVYTVFSRGNTGSIREGLAGSLGRNV